MPGKIAVYAASDNKYIPKVLVSLASFKRFHPDWGYFLLADNKKVTDEMRDLMARFEVTLIDTDLRPTFNKPSSDVWPNECLWILKGPETLLEAGYDYSLAVDGDVMCAAPLTVDWLADVPFLAGIDNGPIWLQLSNGNKVVSNCGLDVEDVTHPATNTGAVWWNNRRLAEMRFFHRVCEIYRACWPWAFRECGDQNLLGLTLAVTKIKMTVLDPSWNFRFFVNPSGKDTPFLKSIREAPDFGAADLKIIHFLGSKPWLDFPNLGVVVQKILSLFQKNRYVETWTDGSQARFHWVNTWRQFLRSVLSEEEIVRYYGQSAIKPTHPNMAGKLWTWTWRNLMDIAVQIKPRRNLE